MLKIKIFLILFFFSCVINSVYSKILIFIPVYNRPDFIELQYHTFKKFLKDEYELVVFSDAKSDEMHQKIEDICHKYNLTCYRIPQKIHDKPYLPRPASGHGSNYHGPDVRNCNVIQYALDTIGFQYNGIVAIVDSDVFLIREFSIKNYLAGALLGGPKKLCSSWPRHNCKKLHPNIKPFYYLWPGLIFFDMQNLPNKDTINMNCGYVYGKIPVDTGGFLHYYLKDNSEVKFHCFDKIVLCNLFCPSCKKKSRPVPPCTHNKAILQKYGLDNKAIGFAQNMPLPGRREGKDIEFLLGGVFVHYRCGTNYANFPSHFEHLKTRLLRNFFDDLLETDSLEKI